MLSLEKEIFCTIFARKIHEHHRKRCILWAPWHLSPLVKTLSSQLGYVSLCGLFGWHRQEDPHVGLPSLMWGIGSSGEGHRCSNPHLGSIIPCTHPVPPPSCLPLPPKSLTSGRHCWNASQLPAGAGVAYLYGVLSVLYGMFMILLANGTHIPPALGPLGLGSQFPTYVPAQFYPEVRKCICQSSFHICAKAARQTA